MKQTDILVPERFRRAIMLHVAKNTAYGELLSPPLILGIHGPPGFGKTFQCDRILAQCGVVRHYISAGQFESPNAGEPARLLRRTYLKAGSTKGPLHALVINDIDLAVGDFGPLTQYTVNRQNVYAELMQLADRPTEVEGCQVQRVPIILTGNDLSKLYAPLSRTGRMVLFEWVPTPDESVGIVERLFPELGLDGCGTLVESLTGYAKERGETDSACEQLPISFFAQLKATLLDDVIWQEVSSAPDLKRLATTSNLVGAADMSLQSLIKKGRAIVDSRRVRNHLVNNSDG